MKRLILFVALVAILAACTSLYGNGTGNHKHRGVTSSPTPTAVQPIPVSGAQWSAWDPFSLPQKSQGQGSITGGGTYEQVCPHVDPALEAARPTSAEKAKVYQAYGMVYPQPYGKYEMDHIIPIELGGAPDSPQNLFPEPNTAPDPAMMSKWHLSPGFVENPKDTLEDALHTLVCAGKVTLAQAQEAISNDWVAAYHTYVEGYQYP